MGLVQFNKDTEWVGIPAISELRQKQIQSMICNWEQDMRLSMGVVNNTVYYMLLDALGAVKQHPAYKHKVKQAFKNVEKEYAQYENTLRLGIDGDFFNINEAVKGMFKDGTTRADFFDWWQGLGGAGYTKIKVQANVIRNKLTLSMQRRGFSNPELLSFLVLARFGFDYALNFYDTMLSVLLDAAPEINRKLLNQGYEVFSLQKVAQAYSKAVQLLPESTTLPLEESEQRNLEFSIEEFAVKMGNISWISECLIQSGKDFKELFTKDGYKKYMTRVRGWRDNLQSEAI